MEQETSQDLKTLRCFRCGEDKPEGAFHKNRVLRSRCYRERWCRDCWKAYRLSHGKGWIRQSRRICLRSRTECAQFAATKRPVWVGVTAQAPRGCHWIGMTKIIFGDCCASDVIKHWDIWSIRFRDLETLLNI